MRYESGGIIKNDSGFTWREAATSLAIAAGIAAVITAVAVYYLNQGIGSITGTGFGTVGQMAIKILS
jgi:hypothetical protein